MNGPTKDGENVPAQPELAAFNLDDVHGYATLGRRVGWTLVFALIIAAIGIGIFLEWRATQ
jgi:hypothetical protein